MASKLTRTWRLLYLLVGVALLAYAIYGHDVMSGIAVLVFAVLGVLLLLRALSR